MTKAPSTKVIEMASPGLQTTLLPAALAAIVNSNGVSAAHKADAARIFIRRVTHLIAAVAVAVCLVSSADAELEIPSVVLVAAPGTTVQPDQVVSLTAIVNLDFVAVTQGTVSLCDAAEESCTGSSLLGVEQVMQYGPTAGMATFHLRLPPGVYQYRAVFEGEPNARPGYASTISAPISITVTEHQARRAIDRRSNGSSSQKSPGI